ncbi:MAG: hypothetical protein R2822_09405 [Spirosomataceae bacterium]
MLGRKTEQNVPSGLENSTDHAAKLAEGLVKSANVRRKEGDVERGLKMRQK